MTAHIDIETLSTYLDRRLSDMERSEVQKHLENCNECCEHLVSLRKVVGSLQALERMAPPSHFGTHLHRLAALQVSETTLMQRLERRVARLNLHSSIAPVFAVVMALILIIYMLSWGLHRQASGRIPVHLNPEGMVEEGHGVESHQQVAGRTFRLYEGVWIELGLEDRAVAKVFSGADPRVRSWLAENPELEAIATLGGSVRLAIDGQVVEIRFAVP